MLTTRESITELDEKSSPSLSLMTWKCKNARQIVIVGRVSFFRKVSHKFTTVSQEEQVEVEKLNIVIKSLVIKKEFGKKTEILTKQFFFFSVNLINIIVVF